MIRQGSQRLTAGNGNEHEISFGEDDIQKAGDDHAIISVEETVIIVRWSQK